MDIKEILAYGSNSKYFDELCDLHINKSIIPFVGAGFSYPAYRGWGDTLMELLGNEHEAQIKKLSEFLNNGEYQHAADYVYSSLEQGVFNERFLDYFSEDKITESGLGKGVCMLPILFKETGLLTLNFDRCIERAYSEVGQSIEVMCPQKADFIRDAIEKIKRPDRTILWKLHGDYYTPLTRVFTSDEYQSFYVSDSKGYAELIRFFEDSSFLFLGCSLSLDDMFMDILKDVSAPSKRIKHYAFMRIPEDKSEFEKRKHEYSKRYIFPIWYPENDSKHESIILLLNELYRCTKNKGVLKSSSTIDTFTTKSIPKTVKDELAYRGISISIPKMEMITIDDIIAICLGKSTRYSQRGLEFELYSILGAAYDEKYIKREIKKDVRGLKGQKSFWLDCFKECLKHLNISESAYYKSDVLVVGIGNGDEGLKLGYDKVAQEGKLYLADIASESLEKARKLFIKHDGKCEAINQPAQDLSSLPSDSMDLYISTMTYQSTFFNIEKALYEAIRVLKGDGAIVISIVNGYLDEKGKYRKGMTKFDSKEIDVNKPKVLSDYITEELKKLGMVRIKTIESDSEIFICGKKKKAPSRKQ